MPVTIRQEQRPYAYDAMLAWVHATPLTIQKITEQDVRPEVQRLVESDLVPYPPPIQKGVFKRYATPKQIRYVMWKIRTGQWTGRTGALGRAWFVTVTPLLNGAVLETGNLSKISKYVVGRFQQRFHFVTGWRTLQSREFEILAAARTVFVARYRVLMRRYFEDFQ